MIVWGVLFIISMKQSVELKLVFGLTAFQFFICFF